MPPKFAMPRLGVSRPWARNPSLTIPRLARGIAQSYLRKVAEAETQWAEKAELIKGDKAPHVWDILQQRGYVKDMAGTPQDIREIMRLKRIGAYVGVDPTADSLHLGHLLPLMALFWMWFHGYCAATLIGGATARIGDPSGRLKSRELLANSDISKNIAKIHFQFAKVWKNVTELKRKYGYADEWAAKRHLLNNSMWLNGLSFYDFTKHAARYTRLGPMLGRDTVKQRLDSGEGLSVAELLYPLFQGWDFWHLYKKLGIQMQIGGSDQFGNIVSGIDTLKLIRAHEETSSERIPDDLMHQPLGFTTPLLTDSSGAKLGKTDGNAVWLDEYKTSAFDLYGYFVRRSDDEVDRLLNLYTFLPSAKITEVMEEHRADPSKRVAQHTVAYEVLSLVHGSQRALEEAKQHEFRFGGQLPKTVPLPSEESGIIIPNNAPRSDIELPRSILKLSPSRLLYACGLTQSVTDAHKLVTQQGAYVAAQPGQKRGLVPGSLNWTPIKLWFANETQKFVIDDRLLIVRKGKYNVRIIDLVSDEDWEKSKRVYPGQPNAGAVRRIKQALQDKAAAAGEPPLTSKDFKRQLKEQQQQGSKGVFVANNPDIELPTKNEMRGVMSKRKGGS